MQILNGLRVKILEAPGLTAVASATARIHLFPAMVFAKKWAWYGLAKRIVISICPAAALGAVILHATAVQWEDLAGSCLPVLVEDVTRI